MISTRRLNAGTRFPGIVRSRDIERTTARATTWTIPRGVWQTRDTADFCRRITGTVRLNWKFQLFSFDEIRLDSGKEELILSKWEISGNAKVRLSNAKSKLLLLLLFLITIERACTNALWERKWIKNRKVYLHGKERCDYDLYCNAKFVKWNVKLSLNFLAFAALRVIQSFLSSFTIDREKLLP